MTLLMLKFLPVQPKKLKTISGFRGHTQKQHGQNLRASDHHRIASTPDAEPVKTSTSAMSFTDQSFGNVFSASLESTLTNPEKAVTPKYSCVIEIIYGRGKFVGDFNMGNIICANFTPHNISGDVH
jgi:hypothetical protein